MLGVFCKVPVLFQSWHKRWKMSASVYDLWECLLSLCVIAAVSPQWHEAGQSSVPQKLACTAASLLGVSTERFSHSCAFNWSDLKNAFIVKICCQAKVCVFWRKRLCEFIYVSLHVCLIVWLYACLAVYRPICTHMSWCMCEFGLSIWTSLCCVECEWQVWGSEVCLSSLSH